MNEPITKDTANTAKQIEVKNLSATPPITANVMMGVLLVPTAISMMDKLLAQTGY